MKTAAGHWRLLRLQYPLSVLYLQAFAGLPFVNNDALCCDG